MPAAETPRTQSAVERALVGVPPLALPDTTTTLASCDDLPLHPDFHARYEPIGKLGAGGYATVISVRDRAAGGPPATELAGQRAGVRDF